MYKIRFKKSTWGTILNEKSQRFRFGESGRILPGDTADIYTIDLNKNIVLGKMTVEPELPRPGGTTIPMDAYFKMSVRDYENSL
jgi:hypothetical protein